MNVNINFQKSLLIPEKLLSVTDNEQVSMITKLGYNACSSPNLISARFFDISVKCTDKQSK